MSMHRNETGCLVSVSHITGDIVCHERGPDCDCLIIALECLDRHGEDECEGAVEMRMPLSGTNQSFPRCERHWAARLERQQEINERYPEHQPSDFDPSYAGERWDEEY